MNGRESTGEERCKMIIELLTQNRRRRKKTCEMSNRVSNEIYFVRINLLSILKVLFNEYYIFHVRKSDLLEENIG